MVDGRRVRGAQMLGSAPITLVVTALAVCMLVGGCYSSTAPAAADSGADASPDVRDQWVGTYRGLQEVWARDCRTGVERGWSSGEATITVELDPAGRLVVIGDMWCRIPLELVDESIARFAATSCEMTMLDGSGAHAVFEASDFELHGTGAVLAGRTFGISGEVILEHAAGCDSAFVLFSGPRIE